MNRIYDMEFNFSQDTLIEEQLKDITGWTKQDLLPLINEVLEEEWILFLNQMGVKSCEVPAVVNIQHIILNIQASSVEEYKSELRYLFSEELRAGLQYSAACNNLIWQNDFFNNLDTDRTYENDYPFSNILYLIFLDKELSHHQSSAIAQLGKNWTLWISKFHDPMKNEIQKYVSEVKNRKRVALYFTGDLQEGIVKLLDPVHYEFIFKYIFFILRNILPKFLCKEVVTAEVKRKTVKSKVLENDFEAIAPSLEITRQCLIEFSLTYLACERGSRFNRKFFMRSVLRQLAHHNNINVNQLCAIFSRIIDDLDMPMYYKSDLLEVLELDSQNRYPDKILCISDCKQHVDANEMDIHRTTRSVKNWFERYSLKASINEGFIDEIRFLLESDPVRLKKLIMDCLKRLNVSSMAGILSGLPEDLLFRICELVNEKSYGILKQYLTTISKLLDELVIENSNRKQIYRSIMVCYFLQENNAATGDELLAYLKYYIERLKSYVHKDSLNILSGVLRKLEAYNKNNAILVDIDCILNRLVSDSWISEKPLIKNSSSVLGGGVRDSSYKRYLYSLESGNWNIDDKLWKKIKTSNVYYLKSLTRLVLQKELVRKRFIHNAPFQVQLDIVEIIEPGAKNIVEQVWKSGDSMAGLFQVCRTNRKVDFLGSVVSGQSATIGKALREFTFSYLLVERGSRFNERSYARSLLRKLSAHHNLDYEMLLASLRENVEKSKLPSWLRKQWLDISGSDSYSLDLGSPDLYRSERDFRKEVLQAEKGALLFSELVECFKSGSQRRQINVGLVLKYIYTNHTLFFHRFIGLLASGEISLNDLGVRASKKDLAILLGKVLRINGKSTMAPSHLSSVIKKYHDRGLCEKTFYLKVIECVLSKKVIDLDRISVLCKEKTDLFAEDSPSPPGSEFGKHALNNELEVDFNEVRKIVTQLGRSISSSKKLVVEGEAKLLKYCFRFNPNKMALMYPLMQVMHLALSEIQLKLLKLECDWSGNLEISNRLTNSQWNTIMYHFMARQLTFPGPVSKDLFVQQVLTEVLKVWQLDARSFDIDGFKGSCVNVILSNRYTQSEVLNRGIQSILTSLTVHDLELDQEPESQNNRVAAQKTIDSRDNSKSNIPANCAGIVLLAPYIVPLFQRVGLCKEKSVNEALGSVGRVLTLVERGKAASLLYYLCIGNLENVDIESSSWILLKILLGYDTKEKVIPQQIDKRLFAQCDELLHAVIQHWAALGSTSIEGLRETFLQRDGSLEWVDSRGWVLRVDPSAFDVLLRSLPWGFSIVKFPFMKDPLHVQWTGK